METIKYHPILFNTPMVQALLNGTKTQTRRTKRLEVINEISSKLLYKGIENDKNECYYGCHFFEYLDKNNNPKDIYSFAENNHKVGDVLWVKETFQIRDSRKPNEVFYKASDDFTCASWKPSIHMPKKYARIFLKIKSIRAERLQDISPEDAKKEGVKGFLKEPDLKQMLGLGNWIIPKPFSPYQFSFTALWCELFGCDNWLANPFVWVYEFERIEKPNDFV
jgi:hypothetical protein